MWDIILGFFIALSFTPFLLLTKLYSKYRAISVKYTTLVLWFCMWSIFGFIVGIKSNENLLSNWINPAFFFIQSLACILILLNFKFGKTLLVLSLIFQIPVLKTTEWQYHNQTMMSITIYFDWLNNFNIEPGSYLKLYKRTTKGNTLLDANGFNVFPLIFIYYYLKFYKSKSNYLEF